MALDKEDILRFTSVEPEPLPIDTEMIQVDDGWLKHYYKSRYIFFKNISRNDILCAFESAIVREVGVSIILSEDNVDEGATNGAK